MRQGAGTAVAAQSVTDSAAASGQGGTRCDATRATHLGDAKEARAKQVARVFDLVGVRARRAHDDDTVRVVVAVPLAALVRKKPAAELAVRVTAAAAVRA